MEKGCFQKKMWIAWYVRKIHMRESKLQVIINKLNNILEITPI